MSLWINRPEMKPAVKNGLVATLVIGVIATVVIGLVLGAHGTPLFVAQGIQLNSVTAHSGPLPTNPTCTTSNSAYMTMVLNNPKAATNISSISVTGTSLTTTVLAYYLNGSMCTQISSMHEPSVNGGGAITPLTLYFGGGSLTSTIQPNQTLNCNIYFADGQRIGFSQLVQ